MAPETHLPPEPPRVDLRPLLPPVRDQGQRGTCLAFAVTAAHEVARAASGVVQEDLSEEALYWGCKQIDADEQPGSMWDSASTALERWGQPLETLWPYMPVDPGMAEPPSDVMNTTCCYRGHVVRIEPSVAVIKQWLREGQIIAIGIWLSRGFFTGDSHIEMPERDDILDEGHAVVVVGFWDGPSEGSGSLIIRNSWGSGWGDGGYGYLPYAYLQTGVDGYVVEPIRNAESG